MAVQICITSLALVAVVGCGSNAPLSDGAQRLLSGNDDHVARAGLSAPSEVDARGIIGVVLGARIVARGRMLAVLDAMPPFVKIYSWDGTVRREFLSRGGAAGEAVTPTAIGILGDTALAVADLTGRISAFNLDGELLYSRTYKLRPLSIVGTCGNDWIVYAPRTSGFPDGTSWLHLIPGDLRGEAVPYVTEGRSGLDQVAFGKAYGVVATETSVSVRHEFGSRPRVFTWSCQSREVIGPAIPLPKREPTRVEVNPDGLVVGGGRGDLGGVGLAVLENGILLADLQASASGPETVLTLVTSTSTRAVRVRGAFAIRDSRPGLGVLFQTDSPVPNVFLVSERSVLQVFR